MLADDVQSPEAATAAERRCCQAHRLIVEVATCRVSAYGDCWIFPDDGGEAICLGSRRALPASAWCDAKVDYERSLVNAEGSSKETIGAVVTGTLVFTDIYLDGRELGLELTSRKPISAALVIKSDQDDAERFQIIWNGEATEFRIPLVGQERRLRAFRGLALLLRNPGRHVAYHLINYLSEKPVDTRQQEPAIRKLSVELACRVKPISERLYQHAGSLDEAHRELDSILYPRFASIGQLTRAPWSKRYAPDEQGMETEVGLYKTVVENTQKSITLCIKFIRSKAPHVADYLEDALVRDPHAVRLEFSSTSRIGPSIITVPVYCVTWQVVVETKAAITDASGPNKPAPH